MATPHILTSPAEFFKPDSTLCRVLHIRNHHHQQYFYRHVKFLLLILLISLHTMETAEAFNYSEPALSCKDLLCANNNVCYTTTENGSQTEHAYCQCQGQWAGLSCQSKLDVTRSSTTTTSITLRVRGMSPSKLHTAMPVVKLYVTDFSISYWNLNGSSVGCNILRLKNFRTRITVRGLDNGQKYMFCVANGIMDLCRLQADNISKTSSKSNCVLVRTKFSEEEPFDYIGFIIAPIFVVVLIAIIIIVLIIKRKSTFVQFILYFFCCRKCYCCKKQTIRRKQHLIRKQRNTSGNFLLPSDPDHPLDDSMSFGARSFASNSALSAVGNRSSMISDSFRSGLTPDIDEKCPSFLEENPNHLSNPNVSLGLEFQRFTESDHIQTATGQKSDMLSIHPGYTNNHSNFNTLPLRQNSSPSTFQATTEYNTLPYFYNHNDSTRENSTSCKSNQQNYTPYFLEGDAYSRQMSHQCNEVNMFTENQYQISSYVPDSNHTPHHSNIFLANHFLPQHSQIPPTRSPLYNTHKHHHQDENPTSTLPNGKPRFFRRHFSTPESKSNEKSPPGAVRVFPHGDEWAKHLQRIYNYEQDTAPTQSALTSLQHQQHTTDNLGTRFHSLRRKRRPIMKQRPLSYEFDYHHRYNLDSDYFSDNARNVPDSQNATTPISSLNTTYALATLPRRHNSQPYQTNTSPRRHPFTRSMSNCDSFYSPHEISTLPHQFNVYTSPPLPHDCLQNGDIFSSSNSKEDTQSMTSSYTESSMSKDSNNSNEMPSRKKRVKHILGHFERTLPPFLRQNSRRNSTTFCDEEYFRDLSAPFVLERRCRQNSNSKKKRRPLSQPSTFEFSGTTSEKINGYDLDPLFQGHPSQHAIPPLWTEIEEECHVDSNISDHSIGGSKNQNDNTGDVGKTTHNNIMTSSLTLRNGGEDSYVISAFDDDATNLVTPFIVKKTSSEESLDKTDVMLSLTDL